MILRTAKKHFDQDILRAKNLLAHTSALPVNDLSKDILRASWMMAVGALDAYFCDAYGDLLARTFRAKKLQPEIALPPKLKNVMVPIPVILDNDLSNGWIWRMIARDLIEKNDVLSIGKIKELFNVFFRKGHKLFAHGDAPVDRWIENQQSMHRLFGFQRTQYRQADAHTKSALRINAIEHLNERFETIFQRRHDCIHNCDRPKVKTQNRNIVPEYIENVITDIEYLVSRCTEDFRSEFPIFLADLGFNAVVRNRVLA